MRQARAHSPTEPVWGIYVHYPLCTRRCGYCDFATVQIPDFPHAAYRRQVEEEAALRWRDYPAGPPATIYLGGGSPSLWPAEEIAALLGTLAAQGGAGLSGLEITVEVNPGDLDAKGLSALREAGVNRLSIGVQSFDDERLRVLTRTHDGSRGRQAFEDARRAGFDNISCDLICGVPGQQRDDLRREIDAMVDLGPEHVSLYGLTLSKASALYRGGLRPLDDDLLAEHLEQSAARLGEAGYLHYEVSNYARPGRESRHNGLVWQGHPYLGLGAAAHSMVTAGARNLRVANPPFGRYQGAGPAEAEVAHLAGARLQVSEPDVAQLETLMVGLRTCRGVEREAFEARFGAQAWEKHEEVLRRLAGWGLLRLDDTGAAPTERGLWFADEVAQRLAA